MRLVCPHCRLLVTVADSAAGRLAECPSCHQPITVPELTGAAIDAAPEPAAPPPAPPVRVARPESSTGVAGDEQSSRPSKTPGVPPVSAGAPWLRLTLRR